MNYNQYETFLEKDILEKKDVRGFSNANSKESVGMTSKLNWEREIA